MGKAIWESSLGTRLGRIFKLGMFLCLPSNGTILISVCGRYQAGRQDRKQRTDLVNSHERRLSGGANIISWSCFFGVALKESVKSVIILWQTTEICPNPGFLLEPEKNTLKASGKLDAETISSWSCDMHGRSCKGMCGWRFSNLQIKRLNNYAKSQRHAWMTINLKKKKMSQ